MITLVTLTILPLLLWLVPPTDALANHIKPSSGTWTAPCGTPGGLACMPDQVFDPVLNKMVPAGREGFATTVINNQIIVTHGSKIGFIDSAGTVVVGDTNDTRIYDIQKDTWSNGKDAFVSRAELAGATDGHLHYAVGGRGFCDPLSGFLVLCNTLEVYDPVKDSWTTLPPMPTARAGLAAAVVGHKLYAIGGRGPTSQPGTEPGTGTALNCVEAYDIDAGTWTSSPSCLNHSGTPELTDMPQVAMDVAAIAVGGKIYVIGGASGPDTNCDAATGAPLLNTVQIYDVAQNTWAYAYYGALTARANLALATCGSVILALGGRGGPACSGPVFNKDTVEAYEISMDIWTGGLNSMPTAKSEHGAVSHGGNVYVTGSGIFGSPANSHEALTCSSLFKK